MARRAPLIRRDRIFPSRDVAAKLANVLVVDLVDLALAEEARLPAAPRERRQALPAASVVAFSCHANLLERDVVVGR
jgi:hypothetical protein